MGCNCGKNKLNSIEEKYGDGTVSENAKLSPFLKIVQFIAQFLFGIFCGAIIIVMVIPILLYIILSIMFGKEPHIDISKIVKILNKGN